MVNLFMRISDWVKNLFEAPKKEADKADESTATAQNEHEDVQHLVPYDENLLEQSRIQWQLGDWASLANLTKETLQHHPDRAKLALLAATGQLQADNTQLAQQLIRLAQDWGCSKRMMSQVLVAGVYSTLGKAVIAAGDRERAIGHFKTAASISNQKINSMLLAETRVLNETVRFEQLQQAAATLALAARPALQTPAKPDVGITSYAQNFEDVMLWRALGRVENGFYIDVGAHDPVVDSVSKAFYERGWRGVHVEPLPEYAEALRNDRPDERVVQAVLAEHPGTQNFYHIPKTGLSTGTEAFAHRHELAGWQVNETKVPATTLTALFDEVGTRAIHWLKIDVEGMEAAVLAGWSTNPARPWVVVMEATEPSTEIPTWHLWENYLVERDYTFIYFDGLNRFYLHATHIELSQLFKIQPNIFDGFTRYV
ncbi:MAG: FkbM family methyltransferase [Rhodoferax sp.]|nr:FkbM family methyltransferase [Rhodoferax sp.]